MIYFLLIELIYYFAQLIFDKFLTIFEPVTTLFRSINESTVKKYYYQNQLS